MSLKRILKLLAAFLTGQGVSVVTQFLIPPLFLARYTHGLEIYGEWVTLTAAVSYLATLNYGVQNYATNQMTIHYKSGEMDLAKEVLSSGFLLVLVIASIAILFGSSLFLMPLSRWMRLPDISSPAASATLFILIVQLVAQWGFSYVARSYMALGEAHRGQNWVNAQRLFAVLALSGCLWYRQPFPILALSQLIAVALFGVMVFFDVRYREPFLLPAFRYASWSRARSMVKPTAYFILLAVSGFLSWQGPVLVIEKVLGPAAVAIFSLSRVVFNMCRMILAVVTYSIGQDVTLLVGQREWVRLRRLYELSEKVVLLLVPTMTSFVLLMGPVLFTLWLHNRTFFHPVICLLMAAISAAIGIKDHKWQFQFSSNQHISLAKFAVWTYAAMLIVAALIMEPFGLKAFLVLWLITESVLVTYILRLNKALFPPEINISAAPVVRLAVVTATTLLLAAWPVLHSAAWPLVRVIGVATGFALLTGLASYFLFDLRDVREVLERRLRGRMAASG